MVIVSSTLDNTTGPALMTISHAPLRLGEFCHHDVILCAVQPATHANKSNMHFGGFFCTQNSTRNPRNNEKK